MSGLNKVILIGHLGGDPEVRFLSDGDKVCNFSLATSEPYKDKKTGERKKHTEWHHVVAYSGAAKIASEFLHKGSKVYIEGKLRRHAWTDQDTGKKMYTVNIKATELIMMDRPLVTPDDL